ncbi:MAG: hypothetical protein QOI58_2263 [Thermoanaerobaculia bacterium]|jgi:DNA-directed RNA polymerase subunit RPC12/RpoP|nr:hypothetical protein [Thermoanaerobaculia bacterium]
MPIVGNNLEIARCPYCQIDRPNLALHNPFETRDAMSGQVRLWGIYVCARCGGVVIASASQLNQEAQEIYPLPLKVDEEIPSTAKAYLEQAAASLHAPAGSVMLAASSVDAMLKAKGLVDGSLNSRINKAAGSHLITEDMAAWAHDIRLDANDQRHADASSLLPSAEDARKCLDFAFALGQFLFVLPARVSRGRAAASGTAPITSV